MDGALAVQPKDQAVAKRSRRPLEPFGEPRGSAPGSNPPRPACHILDMMLHANEAKRWTGFGIVCLAMLAGLLLIVARHELPLSSYKAFYCAGRVTLGGANPYLTEPLRSCEHRIYADREFPAYAVEPAPLPSYAMAGLAALALLNAERSHALFVVLIFAALLLTAWALANVTGFSPALVALACLSLWRLSLGFGEVVPFAVGAIALCGWALQRKKPAAAAIFACIAMIQPHVALPLCAALFVFMPRLRVPLAAGAVVLFGIGTLTVGLHAELAYFTTYLPQQAASEIVATDQYSLTNLLHLAGASDRLALFAGTLSYVAMALAGIYAGRKLALQYDAPAFLAFTPPAFVLLGGTFVHDLQMFAAIPFALLLCARVRQLRWEIAAATALLCVAWTAADSRIALVSAALSAIGVGLIIFSGQAQRIVRTAALTVLVLASLIVLNRLPARSDAMATPVHTAAIQPSAPAAQPWALLIRSAPFWSEPSIRSTAVKVPTWIALLLLVSAGLAQAARAGEEEADYAAEPAA